MLFDEFPKARRSMSFAPSLESLDQGEVGAHCAETSAKLFVQPFRFRP
jgi:hypothetical protein